MAKPCGAKTRNGGSCKSPAMPNGKCRMHGGKSTGAGDAARPGNTNAVTHGFYSSALFDEEERDLYSRATVGSLDDEIKLARVKLYRYVKRAGVLDLQDLVDGALEVVRKTGVDMSGMDFDRQEIKAAAPDYADLIIRQLDLIRKLELARLDIEAEKEEEPPAGIRITVRRATRDAERD